MLVRDLVEGTGWPHQPWVGVLAGAGRPEEPRIHVLQRTGSLRLSHALRLRDLQQLRWRRLKGKEKISLKFDY